ncbi:MAG: tRNA dihydrouridine synthase DusB [Verrucomicrobiales bacterium]|jgi:nifR3 family TIM-barrel protein|nr:tRNA dihydrouridine synthase DusB [Verrucomicrobiales bacterium]
MLTFKNLVLDSPLILAPMAGFTNLPFRAAVRSLGGTGLTVTELVNARSILELHPKALRMIAAADGDRPFGVQLFGADIGEMRDAARFLADLGVDLIDLNMGCPSPKVNACGGGAALLRDEALMVRIAAAVAGAVALPVTVKLRLGWDDDRISAPRVAPLLEQAGVAGITVHGRTRAQGYAGKVNLDAIAETVGAVRIPVVGNGDVRSHADATLMMRVTGCAGVMIGRAALGNPFIFRDTLRFMRTGETPPPVTARQMLAFMHEHFALAVRFLGEEDACQLFRKVVVGYSGHFAHRQRWRVEMQRLTTVSEYWEIVARLAGGGEF